LVSINGHHIADGKDVTTSMSDVKPGDEVTVVVRRDGKQVTEKIVTIENPQKPGRAFIGVQLTVGFHSPVDVQLALANVGGPSAGLMFSLAIVDTLTPDDLADGRNIAGTGTITPQGRVGPIGGIVQKMNGAAREGATLFFAPESNCNEVAAHVPDGLDVVAVKSLDEAVSVLSGKETDIQHC
jgi:PDZ domain-containing protein